MQTITWQGNRLHIQSHNVTVGSHQLELRRCFREDGGPPLLMLPDFLQTGDIFLPRKGEAGEGGLAAFLANLGYDVYMAELRGKGHGWPAISSGSDWGLNEHVCEDLPAHLRTLRRLRPDAAPVWLGLGFGAVLLAAAYARISNSEQLPVGMIHLQAARRLTPPTGFQSLVRRGDLLIKSLLGAARGYVAPAIARPGIAETRKAFHGRKQWQGSEKWLDPVDGFDYGQALHKAQFPPSLYLANRACGQAAVDDCRRWMASLGEHDGRLLTVGKQAGNLRDYSGSDFLQHPLACEDHFLSLQSWLEEHHSAPAPKPAPSVAAVAR